jgi:NAD(P)-dependent dehydrogenase (short-subunit alcohol dehydrogenase family)
MIYRAAPTDGVAWVTGASSGIGRATARELARRGFTVAASSRSSEALEALVDKARGEGGRIVGHPCDVTDAAAIEDAVAAIEVAHGPVALAFLNAGIAPYVRAGLFDAEAFQRAFAVNFFGIVNGLSALLPRMAERKRGQIGVMASLAGHRGLPRAAAYGASKAAAIHMCEALKFDCDRLGVTLQVVNPGFVETPLTAKNDFSMPFLIGETEAGRRIADGFAGGGFEITFPKRLAYMVKLGRILPYRLYFSLVARSTGWNKRRD